MLAILTTHPIQYQVPLWQALARDANVPFEVWYLTDHGTSVSFDSGFGRSFSWDLDTLSGYPYRFIRVNDHPDVSRFRGVRLRESLAGLLEEHRVRVLWVNGWQVQAYWEAVWQAHALGISVWLRGESNDLRPVPAWKAPVKRNLLKQLFRRVDEFLYIGEANRRLYEKFGIEPRYVHPSPYAVDNARFVQQHEALQSRRDAIRAEWRIPTDAFCVLFAGKFTAKKRPADLIRVAQLLARENCRTRIHLLFVGSGELASSLRSLCNVRYDGENAEAVYPETDGAPPASFTGFLNQEEISKAYVAADCLILPSDHGETWGLVANEAMASGLPTIVSDACGCAYDLVPSGWVFRYGDAESLKTRLVGVMQQSPQDRAAALSRVESFTIQKTVDTVTKLCGAVGRFGHRRLFQVRGVGR